MAHYKADVWLGSKSGRQTVSVSASTLPGAVEQICTIYHVGDNAIWNLREVRGGGSGLFAASSGDASSSGGDSEGSLWGGVALIALVLVVWVVATFTPYVFGTAGAAATWWLLCRLQGLSTDALLGPGQRRALLRSLAITISAASLCFLLGLHVQQEVWGDGTPAADQSPQASPAARPADAEQPKKQQGAP
ncbi:MAG: hypothetical protein ACKOPS_24885 [Cyanobium sp.]